MNQRFLLKQHKIYPTQTGPFSFQAIKHYGFVKAVSHSDMHRVCLVVLRAGLSFPFCHTQLVKDHFVPHLNARDKHYIFQHAGFMYSNPNHDLLLFTQYFVFTA